jgi:uncharacterized protein (TIGR02284 family)
MGTMAGKQKDIADLLNSLIEVDLDAVEAYEVAIDRLDDEGDKAQFAELKEDHERHVRELQPLVAELGEEPATKPDIKQVLTKGKVVLASTAGDRLILLAMKTNEDDTSFAYDRAVSRDDLPSHVREVLLTNRDDERRHLAYLEKRIAEYEGAKEVQNRPNIETAPPSQNTPGVR